MTDDAMASADLHFLRHLADAGTAYLHPRARAGTETLLTRLDLQDGQRVLEFGCGTGATLVHVAARRRVTLEGVDVLPEMLRAARRRMAFARLGARVTLRLVEPGAPLAFADGSFSRAYAESVLGILDAATIAHILADVARVLAPGGRFIAGDAIWRDGTTAADVEAVNARCVRDFGLRQATAEPWAAADWLAAGRAAGFAHAAWEPLPSEADARTPARLTSAERRSALFTRAQGLLASASLRHRRARRRYAAHLAEHRDDRAHLISGLLVLDKA